MKRFALAILVMLWPLCVGAQSYPDYESTTVNDFAGLLPDAEEAQVVAQLEQLRKDTGVEMTVVTLSRQDMFAPDVSMEVFATGLFNHWGVGNKAKNDGIMVLVLHTDRAMRVELGKFYGSDWDQAAKRVVDRSFLPAFKDGDYARGISNGVADVIQTIARPANEGSEPPSKGISGMWLVVGSGLLFGLIMFMRKIIDFFARLRSCPSCGQRGGLRIARDLTRKATRTLGGLGTKTTTCTKCDYTDVSDYTTSRITKSSSSSSFGGGSSGGGGASGRW